MDPQQLMNNPQQQQRLATAAQASSGVWPPVRNASTGTPSTVTVPISSSNGIYTPSPQNYSYSSSTPTTVSQGVSTHTNTTATNTSNTQPNMTTAVNLYHLLTSQMSSSANPYATATVPGTSTALPERIINIQDSGTQRDTSATTSGERWMRMAASSRRASDMAAVRRQFRGKVVCNLSCGDCGVLVCKRGMKAILLADTTVELFSTDSPPIGVQMVNDDYETRNCHCRIRDVACLNCGNLVGYHVTQPCTDCLGSCNNGHFWMFHMDQVLSEDRMDGTGSKVLLWAHLPRESDEVRNEMRIYEAMCR